MGRKMGMALVVAAALAVTGTAQAKSGAGCDKQRPTWVHHAGGQGIDQPPTLVPCSTETGFYTGETGIQVAPNGTVWFSAADWEWALARGDLDGKF